MENPSNHYWEPNDQLRNLTIVVPTFQRSVHLLRTVRFWSGRGPQLLVLDGSPTPSTDKDFFDSVEGLTYVYQPESFQSRLVNSSDYIRTDYVTLMGDDEVHMPSSLTASIKELEGNPKLASCLGWSVGFNCRVRKGSVSEIHGFPAYPGLYFYENTKETAQERIKAHFGNYLPSNIYAVVRADAFRNAMKMLNAPGERFFGIGEIEFEIAILYQGGNKVIPFLHWLRNLGTNPDYRKEDPETNHEKMFHDCFLDPEYSAWREEFLLTRSQILAEIDGQEVKHVRIWLEEALQLYSEICASSRSKPTVGTQFSLFLRKYVRSVIPPGHRSQVKEILNKIIRKDLAPSLQEFVKNLSLSGMNYSEEELAQVIEERFQR